MFKKGKKQKLIAISPDEIFLDSKNIPNFDSHQFEGRMEKPIGFRSFLSIVLVFLFLGIFLTGRVFFLQIVDGEKFRHRADNNHLRFETLVPERGFIYDRNGELLAWNEPDKRAYKNQSGLAHVLGYTNVSSEVLIGMAGVEKNYDDLLNGIFGTKVVETDSKDNLYFEIIQKQPVSGESIYLGIDFRIQEQFYEIFKRVAKERGFLGAAGTILDIHSGELLAIVSYPEYDSSVLSSGAPSDLIEGYIANEQNPFLNRCVSGLYAPGSVIKPFIALAALNERIISPEKQIFSSGSISLSHPYFPDKKTVFYDWKAHGWVDMKKALAVSSNVYFYSIGGGYEDINGLGIKKIKEYLSFFGFGEKTGIDLNGENAGIVPSPELKQKNQEDGFWRIGDTYNISIGQGNFQVTPVQMAQAVAILANNGFVVTPSLILKKQEDVSQSIPIEISQKHFKIVKEGMRLAVVEGTAKFLGGLPIQMAAKTGTAELGSGKFVNSWVIGFWPYDEPRFAFSVVLEKGKATNLIGGVFVIKELMDWMVIHTPEYF